MKNSEICRAAMPFIAYDIRQFPRYDGMCAAIRSGVNVGNPEPILKILFIKDRVFENATIYYYPTWIHSRAPLAKREQGYTSRIIFLELAALLWEEEGN